MSAPRDLLYFHCRGKMRWARAIVHRVTKIQCDRWRGSLDANMARTGESAGTDAGDMWRQRTKQKPGDSWSFYHKLLWHQLYELRSTNHNNIPNKSHEIDFAELRLMFLVRKQIVHRFYFFFWETVGICFAHTRPAISAEYLRVVCRVGYADGLLGASTVSAASLFGDGNLFREFSRTARSGVHALCCSQNFLSACACRYVCSKLKVMLN